MAMNEGYLRAMRESYANQEGGITIPESDLHRIVEIPLGFQPGGIAAQTTEGGDQIAMAAYYEPAVCLARVKRDKIGLHFTVDWVRGANHGVQSVRLFPDFFHNDANRLQLVNFGQGGTLWVNRNTDRDFYRLAPPSQPGGRWTLTEKHSLPQAERMIHSALVFDDDSLRRFLTIESPWSLEGWKVHGYTSTTAHGIVEDETPIASINDWSYGTAYQSRDTVLWFVTDFRIAHYHPEIPPGVYRGSRLVVPNVFGNGICFLSDGSALVTRYGQGHQSPFNGVPGALIYVPASLFTS